MTKPRSSKVRTRGRGRKVGQTSQAIAKSARKVGKQGGRPNAKLPAQLLKEIGVPPEDVLKKNAWWSQLIEVLMLGVAKGEPWKSMLELAVRASAQATKQYEGEIKALVAELLSREANETNSEASPPMVERGKDPIAATQRRARRVNPS